MNKTIKSTRQVKQWSLIRLRKEEGLTQQDMADFLGITRAAYQLKENGHRPFIDIEMFKIQGKFNKPMDQIFLPPNSI